MAISGGFMTIFLNNYIHAFPTWTWPIFTLAFVGLAAYLMIRGVHISTTLGQRLLRLRVRHPAAGQHHRHHPARRPASRCIRSTRITWQSGAKGLGLGFPAVLWMFIGWEAAGPLAEETDKPRKNIPRALFASVALMLGSFMLFAYATVESFGENVDKLSSAPIPFVTVASHELSALAFLAYVAGVTSTVGCLIAATNSQARLLFNSGREGLFPKWLGKVSHKHGTPVRALHGLPGHRPRGLLRLGRHPGHLRRSRCSPSLPRWARSS